MRRGGGCEADQYLETSAPGAVYLRGPDESAGHTSRPLDSAYCASGPLEAGDALVVTASAPERLSERLSERLPERLEPDRSAIAHA
ncbi:MAG TPA: hypothetical protein VGD53_15330 [Actinoallomurus sp.]